MLTFNLRKLKKHKYYVSKFSFKPLSSKKKETIYFTNEYTPRGFDVYMIIWIIIIWTCTNYRKIHQGRGCVEKVVEAKLSIQYIKNNLQQLKEIAVFII